MGSYPPEDCTGVDVLLGSYVCRVWPFRSANVLPHPMDAIVYSHPPHPRLASVPPSRVQQNPPTSSERLPRPPASLPAVPGDHQLLALGTHGYAAPQGSRIGRRDRALAVRSPVQSSRAAHVCPARLHAMPTATGQRLATAIAHSVPTGTPSLQSLLVNARRLAVAVPAGWYARHAVIRARLFRSEHPPADAAVADWPALCQDDANILWVDAHAPSEAEFADITRLFHIDPRAAESARQVSRRAAVRVFEEQHLVTVLALQVDEAHGSPRITVIELDVFIGRNFLVSLHKRPLPFAEAFDERTASNPHVGHFDSAYLLYLLLDSLVGYYARAFD